MSNPTHEDTAMEPWRTCWRDGVAPLLSTESLEALRLALESEDPRLLQGATLDPVPLQCTADWPVVGACLLSYPGVLDLGGFGTALTGEAEAYFATACFEADQLLGEAGAIRHLIHWWDDTPREFAREQLLTEVRRTLAERLAATN
jgi:hypothetical protein